MNLLGAIIFTALITIIVCYVIPSVKKRRLLTIPTPKDLEKIRNKKVDFLRKQKINNLHKVEKIISSNIKKCQLVFSIPEDLFSPIANEISNKLKLLGWSIESHCTGSYTKITLSPYYEKEEISSTIYR